MPVEELTTDNEGDSFVYLPEVADNEDQGLMDFFEYLLIFS
jgi:hypothetical protein